MQRLANVPSVPAVSKPAGWFVAGTLLLLVACGGKVVETERAPADGRGGTGGVGGTDAAVAKGGSAGIHQDASVTDAGPVDPPSAGCSSLKEFPIDPCTEQELRDLIAARWWRCSGAFMYEPSDAVGLEVTGDGQWYALVLDGSGQIVRTDGVKHKGTWKAVDTSIMNGPCSWQVDFHTSQGFIPAFVTFSEEPRGLRLAAGGSSSSPTYVAVP